MPTNIKGRFDKPVAEKIYSNCVKENPAFKPWKGKDGCAWFGYDGNPNPGALAREKPIEIEATTNIPANASVISKQDLEAKLESFLILTKQHFGSAEGKLWTWVGELGAKAESGFMIVEVGLTKLSPLTDGKYLLVNNVGMAKVYLTETQKNNLEGQLDKNILQRITAALIEKEKLHGKVVHLKVSVPKEKFAVCDEKAIGEKIANFAKSKCYVADTVVKITFTSVDVSVWNVVRTKEITAKLEFNSYTQAKRNARVFVGTQVQVQYTDKSIAALPVNVAFGQAGTAYAYKNTGNVVNPPVFGIAFV